MAPEPVRGPIGHFGTPNDVRAGNDPPAARVTRHGSVVTENEVSTAWVASPTPGFVTAVSEPKIRLTQPGAVDEGASGPHRDGLPGQADDPFDEGPAGVARSFDPRRTLEDDDVASFGLVEPIESRSAMTRSATRDVQPLTGLAQWRVGSIDGVGIRYGFATSAWKASTPAIASVIVSAQSISVRSGVGRRD